MSFDVVFTKSAEIAAKTLYDLPELEVRARDAVADLPGEGLQSFEQRMFHAVSLDDGTDLICSVTADGALRVDACAVAEA